MGKDYQLANILQYCSMNAVQNSNSLFAEFPPQARVWIYQASRPLTEKETSLIREKAKAFALNWNAHKQPLTADAEVAHNLFLVLIADEAKMAASGCSIDSSVRLVKELEQEFQLVFFDRLNVAYQNDGTISLANYQTLVEDIKSGKLPRNISIFNNVIQTKGELETNWLIPVEKSWLSKLIVNG